MTKKTLAMTSGAFVAGALCAFWAFGISEYRIEIPTKELYTRQADVLFLEDVRGEFDPVAFTQEEKNGTFERIEKREMSVSPHRTSGADI